jgi:hypothetical protein
MLNKQTIKKKISIEQVARYYGLQIDRYGNCLCPFHADENPSMKINGRRNGKAHCFVCGKSWDIFDFVMDKELLTLPQALEFIDNIFGLGLGNRHWDKATLERIKKERLEEQRKQKAEEQRLKRLAIYEKSVVETILKEYNKYNNLCIRLSWNEKIDIEDWSNRISDHFFKALKLREYYYELLSYIQGDDTNFDYFGVDRIDFMRKLYKGEYKLNEFYI